VPATSTAQIYLDGNSVYNHHTNWDSVGDATINSGWTLYNEDRIINAWIHGGYPSDDAFLYNESGGTIKRATMSGNSIVRNYDDGRIEELTYFGGAYYRSLQKNCNTIFSAKLVFIMFYKVACCRFLQRAIIIIQ
jgi:hypothetical protein